MIAGELTVRKYGERGGKELIGEYSRMIIVKSDPRGMDGGYLHNGKSGIPVQFKSDNENQFSCSFLDNQMRSIVFHFRFSPVATNNVYKQKGRFVKDGKFAPYWFCSFRKDKYSRLQNQWKKLRGIIREIRFLISATVF